MKILIDGRCLEDTSTGIKRYTLELIKNYIQKYGYDNVFVLLRKKTGIENFQTIIYDKKAYCFWNFFKLNKFISKLNVDVVHFPAHYNSFCKAKGKIYITTMHDIMYKVVPKFYRENKFINYLGILKTEFFIKRSLKNSDKIISISSCTAQDIKKHYKYDSLVIPCGLNSFSEVSVNNKAIDKWNLSNNGYFLYVGLTMKHKNIPFLIESFLEAKTDKKLVICGKNNGNIQSENKNIIFTGFVSDDELVSLYKNCSAFIFPSLYEGFGLPVLEALNLGAKVFSSNGGSLKEFSSDIINFFDPTDKESLIKLIEGADDIKLDKDAIQNYLSNFEWEKVMSDMNKKLDL